MNRENRSLREIYLFVAIGCAALVAVGCDDMMNGNVDDANVTPSQGVDQTYQPNDSPNAPAAVPMGQTDSAQDGSLFETPDTETTGLDLDLKGDTNQSDEVVEEVNP